MHVPEEDEECHATKANRRHHVDFVDSPMDDEVFPPKKVVVAHNNPSTTSSANNSNTASTNSLWRRELGAKLASLDTTTTTTSRAYEDDKWGTAANPANKPQSHHEKVDCIWKRDHLSAKKLANQEHHGENGVVVVAVHGDDMV